MSTTWILVADSARARLFATTEQDDGALVELEDFLNPECRGRELEADRPPRTFESVGSARHAIEDHTSYDQKSLEFFARELDAVLERGRVGHRYDDIVIIAPPHFLGALNSTMGKHVRDCVIAELPKDLSSADARTIRDHLPARLGQLRAAAQGTEPRAPRP